METVIGAAISAVATIVSAWMVSRTGRRGVPPQSEQGSAASEHPAAQGALPGIRRSIVAVGQGIGTSFAHLWKLMDRLPQLNRRTRPWLAALLGFIFSGFGIALYFRTWVDAFVGILLLLPLGFAGSHTTADASLPWWAWVFAALSSFYGFLRALSSSRRLEAEAPLPPPPRPD